MGGEFVCLMRLCCTGLLPHQFSQGREGCPSFLHVAREIARGEHCRPQCILGAGGGASPSCIWSERGVLSLPQMVSSVNGEKIVNGEKVEHVLLQVVLRVICVLSLSSDTIDASFKFFEGERSELSFE